MRSKIEEYNAVVEAASKFTKSVAEGNSKYAKELFTEDAYNQNSNTISK